MALDGCYDNSHNWAEMNSFGILGSGLSYLFGDKEPNFSIFFFFRIVLLI